MSGEDQAQKNLSNEELLLAAVAAGREDEVEHLLEEGVDLEQCESEDGSSALHLAARAGKAAIVRLLLRHGADIDAFDAYMREPIHDAAYGGDVETLRVLVEAGASVTICDEENLTPAHYAAREGRVLMLEEIERLGGLKHTESTERDTPLSSALRGINESTDSDDPSAPNHVRAARFLVAHGANPDQALMQYCDLPGTTRKHVELLIELGANPEHETSDGWRPAAIAARDGRREVLEALLDDPRTTRETLNLALAVAVLAGKGELHAVLIDRGADARIPEMASKIPGDRSHAMMWFDGLGQLRRQINADLLAGDIDAAMCGEGDAVPAPASRGFTL